MTAGSCSVAIRRSRPPQWTHARTSIANARCMRAAQVQARGVGFTPVPSGPGVSGAVEAAGSAATRPYATTRSRQRAARGQHAMAYEQVGFRPWRHRRQALQEFQRLEDQLSCPVVPRRLQLERDAAVVPQPQPLLRKRRAQDISGQALQPRPIVRRYPHVGMQVEPVQVPAAARATSRAAAVSRAPPSRAPAPPAWEPSATRPWTEAPTISASTGDSSASRSAGPVASSGRLQAVAHQQPLRPVANRRQRRCDLDGRSAPAPDETPARPRALR
jgi:hypothetical protein